MELDQRQAYQQKMEAGFEKMRADIDKFAASVKERQADAQIGLGKQVDGLREKGDAAKARLEELKTASGDAWENARSGFAKAWGDLESAFGEARDKLKDA